jgi:fused signal recognition particle receptor
VEFISLFGKPEEKKPSVLDKIKTAVRRTQENLNEGFQNIVEGKKTIDPEMLEELEGVMVSADVGIVTTTDVLTAIREQMSRQTLQDPRQLRNAVKDELRKILRVNTAPPKEVAEGEPFVILMVGVNGVGKTTTIGKLANRFKNDGKRVMLCASDTFHAGADPSAVLFDALQSAKSKKIDYVIVDTAGRLHTKSNLMTELEKMTRIAKREVSGAPHEVLLVMDATTGQNGLTQAREFTKSAAVTGIVLTKLDGTAKGGVVTAIARELKIPIRFVGVGEKIDDLIEFSPDDFVESLFAQ